jgi:hypothetical protein
LDAVYHFSAVLGQQSLHEFLETLSRHTKRDIPGFIGASKWPELTVTEKLFRKAGHTPKLNFTKENPDFSNHVAPVDTALRTGHTIDSTKTNFDRIISTPTSFDGIEVSMYKSRETGLKVLVANVEVPIVCPVIRP